MSTVSFNLPRIFGLIALVSPWLNPLAPGPSPPMMQSFVTWIGLAVILLLTLRWADDFDAGSFFLFAWLIAGFVSSVLGSLQYFGKSAFLSPWVNSTASGEAFANLRQRNQYATLINMALVSLFLLAARERRRQSADRPKEKLWLKRVVGLMTIPVAGLLAIGIATSSSRTGLAQLILIVCLLGLWDQLRQPAVYRLLFVTALTYALASIALPRLIGMDSSTTGILARLHDGDPACSSRLTLWSNVLHLIAQKPWTGWGWGELDYAHFITPYLGLRFCEILDNAHNLPLHLAVELGLPFATLVFVAAAWLVVRAKPWQETDTTRQMAWAILALIMLHSMLEYPLWYGPFQMTFAICIWLLLRKPQPIPTSPSTIPNSEMGSNKAITSALATGFAFALLAFTAYAAWDYHRISQIYLTPEERTEAYRDNTLEKLKASWLFRDQVRFAELTTTELTPDNAVQINTLAKEVMHFSPEARVVQKVIESAVVLGHSDEALFFMQRFKAAYPQDYEQWAAANTGAPGLKSP